jgi:hypothetical protein
VRRNPRAFLRKLASRPYTVLGLLCTGSPVLEKWKWKLALGSSARLVLINEHASYFTLDVWNLKTARMVLLKRLSPFADYSTDTEPSEKVTGPHLFLRRLVRRFLSRAQPRFDRILLIESGPRKVTEEILRYFYEVKGARQVDILTCYGTAPAGFDLNRGTVYSVNDEAVRRNRRAFIRQLSSAPYTVLSLLCTGSPILERWKWMLALRSSARLIIVNEHAKYFSLDFWNLKTARLMLSKRLNPFGNHSSSGLLSFLGANLAGLLLAPFTITYLLLFTALLHVRRWFRSRRPLAS